MILGTIILVGREQTVLPIIRTDEGGFFSADKPNPPILQAFYGDGKKISIIFCFANMSRQRG